MEVETEPNIYEQYEEYVKQVEVKQSDDISAEVEDEKDVDVISRFIYHVCENYETGEDDKAGDNEVEECAWVPRERKSVLGYQRLKKHGPRKCYSHQWGSLKFLFSLV
jgi:hypothetical protein